MCYWVYGALWGLCYKREMHASNTTCSIKVLLLLRSIVYVGLVMINDYILLLHHHQYECRSAPVQNTWWPLSSTKNAQKMHKTPDQGGSKVDL